MLSGFPIAVIEEIERWKKYATSEIKIYTAQGIKTVAIRINGKEYLQ